MMPMKSYVFYNYERAICGKSKIMYRGKWYLLLYACEDYVIIKLRGKYTKIDKYDVEDCTYHNTVVDEKDKCVRQRTGSELKAVIREGEAIIACGYDVDEIEACKQGLELYKSVNLNVLFLSGMLVKYSLKSDDELLYKRFNKFVSMISELPLGDTRRGINICMIESFEPMFYSCINEILEKYAIYTDRDAIRCLSFKFIIDLLYIIEGD